jgi:hypothetical protein
MADTTTGNAAPFGALDLATNLKTAIVTTLKADATLAAIVEGRIYPPAIPETKAKLKPSLVFAVASTDRLRNLAGFAGIATSRVLFDARSPLYSDCERIKEALRQYDGFRGFLADIAILSTRFDDDADEFEWPGSGGAPGTHHLTITMFFKYREPIPTFID